MLPDFLQQTAGTTLDNRLTGGFIPSRATLVLVPTNLHKQWLSLDQQQESIVRLGRLGFGLRSLGLRSGFCTCGCHWKRLIRKSMQSQGMCILRGAFLLGPGVFVHTLLRAWTLSLTFHDLRIAPQVHPSQQFQS